MKGINWFILVKYGILTSIIKTEKRFGWTLENKDGKAEIPVDR
jgi:hypothetical protein